MTEKKPVSEAPEIFQTRMPDCKRTALLRYMIIMFAVAFVLVLMSMVLQVKSSNSALTELHHSSTSALAKAESLQDTNRKLEEQIRNLQKDLERVSKELTDTQTVLTDTQTQQNAARTENATLKQQLETAWTANEKLSGEKENQRIAYEALARVLMGPTVEGDVSYARALQTLQNMKQYLSPEIVARYDAVQSGNVQ